MVPDGRPAAKFIASLVLVGLSIALAWTIAPTGAHEATAVETRVSERSRPAVAAALDRARANGDAAMVAWLERILREQDAARDAHERHNAGARH